jgi:hypothetical protein
MDISSLLNITGLTVNILGAALMFTGSAKVDSVLYLYNKADLKRLGKQDRTSNRTIRLGMLFLFIGFLFQLSAVLF